MRRNYKSRDGYNYVQIKITVCKRSFKMQTEKYFHGGKNCIISTKYRKMSKNHLNLQQKCCTHKGNKINIKNTSTIIKKNKHSSNVRLSKI